MALQSRAHAILQERSVGRRYKFYAEFQSHQPEFDYLKSLEIEERINQIKWCARGSDSFLLLTTNDKTIKLWRVSEQRTQEVVAMNMASGSKRAVAWDGTHKRLKVPRVVSGEVRVAARARRKYANAHAYHINSVSLCSDGINFVSADDLRM